MDTEIFGTVPSRFLMLSQVEHSKSFLNCQDQAGSLFLTQPANLLARKGYGVSEEG